MESEWKSRKVGSLRVRWSRSRRVGSLRVRWSRSQRVGSLRVRCSRNRRVGSLRVRCSRSVFSYWSRKPVKEDLIDATVFLELICEL